MPFILWMCVYMCISVTNISEAHYVEVHSIMYFILSYSKIIICKILNSFIPLDHVKLLSAPVMQLACGTFRLFEVVYIVLNLLETKHSKLFLIIKKHTEILIK